MGETVRHAGAARAMRFTLLRVDVPVMQVSSGVREFEAFVDGTLAAPEFTRQLGVGYANEREQFGKKIGAFQAVSHQLVNACIALEGCAET